MNLSGKTQQLQKPPQRVAHAVSIFIFRKQDTIRQDENRMRGCRSRNLISELIYFGASNLYSLILLWRITRLFRLLRQIPLFNVAILHSPTLQS